MYEHRRERLLPFGHFVQRVVGHALWAAGLIAGSLFAGMLGYRALERMSWLDAFLNASMILGGMGPVATLATDGGKLFAGLYALYAGGVFLVVTGLLLAPVLHRVLHRFHLGEDDSGGESAAQRRRA